MTRLGEHDIAQVRAANPGPLTLSGTNTWIAGRDPCWIVDPGPALDDHLDAVAEEAERRGGCGGVALTHGHPDHVEGTGGLLERLGSGVPVGAARHPADVRVGDGDTFGPLGALAVPGHASDHLVFVWQGAACFTGDVVLGEGSVFIAEDLGGYLAALRRLRELDLAVLCPGHGPPVWNPSAKLDEYVRHRLDRERLLVEALERGLRADADLLDAAWDDVPAALRPAARLTLRAHLDKLGREGRLPAGWTPDPLPAEYGPLPAV